MATNPRLERGLRRYLRNLLGDERFGVLEHGLGAFERVLPHTEVSPWRSTEATESQVVWGGANRRDLVLRVQVPGSGISVEARLARLAAPAGVGRITRTIDMGERGMAERVVEVLSRDLAVADDHVSSELRRSFDERVIASYLTERYKLKFEPRPLIDALRGLAEQTYETRSMTFGVLIDPSRVLPDADGSRFAFPQDYLRIKKYRVLSDGYRVAYQLDARGTVVGLTDLTGVGASPKSMPYFPEWARYLALGSRQKRLGIALTRHGDILVFANGNLHLSYRSGQWRYWNHSHVIDLVSNRARAQHVDRKALGRLIARLYRLALDISFRHTGGLILILRNRGNIHQVVRQGDAMADPRRSKLDRSFDGSLRSREVQAMPLPTLSELSGLDGAIVVANSGELLAYGAVLQPSRKVRAAARAEGARTKAAIGASCYGIGIKVSSDGDITFYQGGKEFLSI